MTKLKDIKVSCHNCKFASQPTHWYWQMSLVICNNEESDNYGHVLFRDAGCQYGVIFE